MTNLNTAKQKIEFFEVNSPEEFVINSGFDTELTDRFFEMMRSLQFLHNQARHYRGGGQHKVSFRNAKGQLKSATKYDFIMNGLPKIMKGLKQILNIQDQEEMAASLKRFEAIVRLVCIGHVKYDTLTGDMIAEQIRTTQNAVNKGRETYDERNWTLAIKHYGIAYHYE